MRVTQFKSLRLENISCIAHSSRFTYLYVACPGPMVSLGPHTWMPPSKKLACVPLNNSQLIGYHPRHQSLFSAFVPSFTAPLSFVSLFFLFFFLPYYELVELGTTTLGRKLGIIFAQRLLLPSDGPKNAGVAAMKQRCRSVHRKMHRKWDDMPPNGISDANTPRKKPKTAKGVGWVNA